MSLKFCRNPHAQRAVSVLTGIAFAGSLLLSACSGGATSSGMPQQSSAVSSVTKLPASGKAPVFKTALLSGAKTSNRIAVTASSAPGTGTVQLQLPADADAESLAVTLNGKDISGRFMTSDCADGECMKATVSAGDGYAVKNVVNASVRKKTGGMASGRARFAAAGAATSVLNASQATALSVMPKSVANATVTALGDVCDTTTMCPPWLAPSVTFNTLMPGGWNPGRGAWIEVNGQKLPGIPPNTWPADCGYPAKYVVVVLDRQTLLEKTAAPESSPECFSDSASMAYALGKLAASDLVIVGTIQGQVADAQLDTTAIGGSAWAKAAPNLVPVSYMAIGAAGQPSGSAYENYDISALGIGDPPQFNVFATGTLQEDTNGNYGFQSSDVVEYAVSPNDPGYFIANTSGTVIAMNLPADLTDEQGPLRIIYTLPVPNTPTAPFNGLWLLVLDRTTLQPIASQPCSGQTSVAPTVLVQPCGNTYAVDNDQNNTPDQNWRRLASDLSHVGTYQLAILVSVNTINDINAAHEYASGSGLIGFPMFATALQNIGGTYSLVGGPTFSKADSYALVGFGGASNPLVGGAAEASTMLRQQGQSGVLHGTLQRNRNGLYQPMQTSQEPQAVFAAKGGLDDSDFAMALVSFQQPVDWPSNSDSTGLPGVTSILGQRAAYRFISHWLLAGYYVKGIAGPHQDDLHYFFSGSSNTWIDYHTMDPADLPFPATGTWPGFGCITSTGSTCTFQAPGDSATSGFSAGDFNAVKAQMSLEVQYLTNTLQFLVTGSTNMKDVVAAGNANVGLALSGAAATILGSKFANEQQLAPTTQVKFSWQSLLGLLGGIASTIANAEGVGELLDASAWASYGQTSPTAQKAIKNGVGISNSIGALLATIGSAGSLTSKSSTNGSGIPQPFAQFTTTIGDLANGELQSQLIVGFDVLADNLTSDWARLRNIGPRVVDVNDALYAPNQASQNTALQTLTNASAQTFYFSLLPSFYHIDVWLGVLNTQPSDPARFQPGIGYGQGNLQPICYSFYVSPNNAAHLGYLSSYQGIAFASLGPYNIYDPDTGNNDVFVIAGAAKNPNTDSTFIPSIDIDLARTLFAPDQLNVSMQQFVAANGPMPQSVGSSVSNTSGWPADKICDVITGYPEDDAVPPSSGKDWFGDTITTTTLTSATSNTLGQDTVLTAVVKAGDQAVAGGIMYFSIDGQVVGKATVGADGTATLTLPEATLGKHSVQADYAPPNGYAASSTDSTTLGVYAGAPDLTVAAANTSLDVSYDKPSQPLALTIGSVAGLSGDVQLSCTGLPAGMSCKFDTPTPTLAADGSAQVSVVIGPSVATEAALGLLFLPMLMIGWRREDGSVRRRALPALLALCMAATALTGCSGDSSSIPRETGTKTVLINATVGGVSRSVAVDVHID
jgi:hypothetical protein